MKAYELIHQLAQYPIDTEVKLAADWGEPVLDDTYLVLEDGPCLCITNTPESQERVSAALAAQAR